MSDVGSREPWQYQARQDIADLVARYNFHGDVGRFEEQAQVFAEGGVMELDTPAESAPVTVRGRRNIQRAIEEVGRSWARDAKAAGRRPFVRHFVTTHVVDFEREDRATGHAYALVLMDEGLDHWGTYSDSYVKEGGLWKIGYRRAHTEGSVRRVRGADAAG